VVLEGITRDQISLVQALQLAARLVSSERTGGQNSQGDIEVPSDEADGRWFGGIGGLGGLGQGGGAQGGGAGGLFGGAGGGGFAGAGGLGVRRNEVLRNIGRASVLGG
jgi:hypothetical protein